MNLATIVINLSLIIIIVIIIIVIMGTATPVGSCGRSRTPLQLPAVFFFLVFACLPFQFSVILFVLVPIFFNCSAIYANLACECKYEYE